MSHYFESIPTPPRVLTSEEQKRLLKITGLRVDGLRDHILISAALGTGMREHELCALKVGDIVDRAGRVKSHIILTTFKKATDNPALQDIVIPERLRVKFKKYLDWKKRQGHSMTADAPLFLSKKKNALSTKATRTMFRKWQEEADFDAFYTFHSLRHTAITNVYRKTRDLRLAQRFARHKSLAYTQRYAHPTIEDIVIAVQDIPC